MVLGEWLILVLEEWLKVPDLGDIAELLKLTEDSCWLFGLETEACYIKRVQSTEAALQEVKLKWASPEEFSTLGGKDRVNNAPEPTPGWWMKESSWTKVGAKITLVLASEGKKPDSA